MQGWFLLQKLLLPCAFWGFPPCHCFCLWRGKTPGDLCWSGSVLSPSALFTHGAGLWEQCPKSALLVPKGNLMASGASPAIWHGVGTGDGPIPGGLLVLNFCVLLLVPASPQGSTGSTRASCVLETLVFFHPMLYFWSPLQPPLPTTVTLGFPHQWPWQHHHTRHIFFKLGTPVLPPFFPIPCPACLSLHLQLFSQ